MVPWIRGSKERSSPKSRLQDERVSGMVIMASVKLSGELMEEIHQI